MKQDFHMFNAIRSWRGVSCALALLGSLLSLPASAATTEAHSPHHAALPDIVLVHGAFADGSSWSPVIKLLQRKGYHVTAVQNPLTSLADDVATTRRVLDRQKGGVILVGHSWAGTVVTEAGSTDNVLGLVYLSALVPDAGESTADLLTRLAAPMEGFTPDEDGLLWLDDPVAYRHVMAGDVSAAQAALLAATQQPMAARAFGDKVTTAAWHSKPSWYLVTENDNALPTRVQRTLAQAIGATTVSLKASHMSLVSHPDAVVALIERAARSVGK